MNQFKKILFILLITLFLGGCKLIPVSNPSNDQADGSKPPVEIPADWLTYTNEKFNYFIRYHPDWHAQQPGEPPYPPPPAGMNFSRRFSTDPVEVCDFEILASDFAGNFDGEIDSLSQDNKYQKTEADISGSKAIKFTLSNNIQLVESYYFSKANNQFRMGFNIMKGNNFNFCQDVFTKMLASFKLE